MKFARAWPAGSRSGYGPNSYSGDVQFESRLGHWLPWALLYVLSRIRHLPFPFIFFPIHLSSYQLTLYSIVTNSHTGHAVT
jgi:hypothetical protein